MTALHWLTILAGLGCIAICYLVVGCLVYMAGTEQSKGEIQ